MNTTRGAVRAATVAATAALGAVGAAAQGQCLYELTVLADQGCPFGSTELGYGMNEWGVVVGNAWECFGDHIYATVWEDPDELIKLDFPWPVFRAHAYDINSQGIIVGTAAEAWDIGIAFLFDGSAFLSLGTLAEGPGNYSVATAINEQGTIVGYVGNSTTGDPPHQPFIWRDGVMTALIDDLATEYGWAYDVDEAGRLVGGMGQGTHIDSHAFLWDAGEVTDLGVVPGGYSAEAQGMNNRGDIVGFGRVHDPARGDSHSNRGFLWSGSGMIDLGAVPGFTDTYAYDINDMGQIVGGCNKVGTVARAFLWQHGVMTDLNDLFATDEVIVGYARAVNNRGQIAGYDQGPSAFLLTPLNRPEGDTDCDCQVGALDLVFLLSEWSRTDSPADLNTDGIVDVLDLLIVLADWGTSTGLNSADRR